MSLNTGRLAGAADRLDVFMGNLTLAQLRGTVTMGFVLLQPALRRDYERHFDAWDLVIGDLAAEYARRRRSGQSPIAFGMIYAGMLGELNEGARLMRPHFPRRDTLSDKDFSLLDGLHADLALLV
ncbi:MAG TPA: hypothetical protein VFS14_00875 [Candidatus Saccharimonadales bacterium]|nr:hypothetical protein [Candidatus Saccharimonadales bacterium]